MSRGIPAPVHDCRSSGTLLHMPAPPAPWFDAHLDLACLAVEGRNLYVAPKEAGGIWLPGSVTFPALQKAEVCCALGTIFVEPGGAGAVGYPAGDAEAARRKGRAQLEVYLTAQDRGALAIDIPAVLRTEPGVGEVRGGMGVSEVVAPDPARAMARRRSGPPLHIGVLIEGADPVRTPIELPWWIERGVIAIGLAWWKPSRYAGGNGSPGVGLTALGREMVGAMDALGLIHDVSHLSDRSLRELLDLTDRPVMASHSNCRSLVDPTGANERHLTDDAIREIGRRGGVVGVNLVSNFLDPTATREPPKRARFETIIQHIERVAELMGRRDGVGLGSDMDGGFSAEFLPEGVNGPADLHKITEALGARGWTETELAGFRFNNWARFLAAHARVPAGRSPATA